MSVRTENKILKPEYRCRICLEASNGKITINQNIDYKKAEISLNELLEFCVNAQVCENGKADGLCLPCMGNAIVCYEFKKKFEESQCILLKEIEEGNSFVIKTEEDLREEDLVEIENVVLKKVILDNDVLFATENGVLQEEISDEEVLTENVEILKEEILDDDVLVVATGSGVLKEEILDEEILTENNETLFLSHLRNEEILGEKSQITENIKCHEEKQDILKTPGDKPTAISLRGQKHHCDICKKIFQHSSDLSRHRINEQFKEDSAHKCWVCGETFIFRASLMRHKLEHEQNNTAEYKCTCTCVQHTSKHPQKVAVVREKMPCLTCGRIFFNKQALNVHMLIHSGEKPFKCEFCERSFSKRSTLARHSRFHTGERPYKCLECEKDFALNAALLRHQVVHSKKSDILKREHVCHICGADFTTSECLRRHIRNHSIKRPFKCTICSKSFKLRWLMKQHMVIHTGVRNYECEFSPKNSDRRNPARLQSLREGFQTL